MQRRIYRSEAGATQVWSIICDQSVGRSQVAKEGTGGPGVRLLQGFLVGYFSDRLSDAHEQLQPLPDGLMKAASTYGSCARSDFSPGRSRPGL